MFRGCLGRGAVRVDRGNTLHGRPGRPGTKGAHRKEHSVAGEYSMRLEDFLSQDMVTPDLSAEDKRGVLEEMVDKLVGKVDDLDRDHLIELLLAREKLGSTGIGYGVAIPHAKLDGVDRTLVTFGRSAGGIDFQSMDDKPAHLFFLIFAPEGATTVHLKVLARISQLLKDASFREKLMNAPSREELYRIIIESDRKHKASA